MSVEYSEDERWLVVTRGSLRIAVNFSEDPAELPVESSEQLFTSDASITPGRVLTLPGHSVAVVR